MKKLWLLILSLFISIQSAQEMPLMTPVMETITYADFRTSYNRVREYEGYYVNHKDDKGLETYAGITSKYNNDWQGWKYVRKHNLKWNQPVTGKDSVITEFYVLDYYLTIWVREGFDKLTNQEVADYLFDTRIHLSRRSVIKLMNRTYNMSLNKHTREWIDPSFDTLNINLLKLARIQYYAKLIERDSTQKIFKTNWLKRAT
jgi:hypothetical protein